MKKILSMALVVLGLYACKKDKTSYTPTKVTYGGGYLEFVQNEGANTNNWYSIKAMDGTNTSYSAEHPEFSQSIIFGYYFQGNSYGLYSPDNFPVELGQKDWSTRLPISFRNTNITADQMKEFKDQYKEGFPVQFILDKWNKGTSTQKSIIPVVEGETYAFRSQDGKIAGLVQIENVADNHDYIQFEIWVAE